MENLLHALRAAGEDTRLRILALCGEGELTVSELTHILGQSQPRVSHHLKRLVEAGLLGRSREGQHAYYGIAANGGAAVLAATLLPLIPSDDPIATLDPSRRESVRAARATRAAAFFRDNAADWDQIRRLHVNDAEVEDALLTLLPTTDGWDHLDIGTGTGRILEVVGPRAGRAVGVDFSREMLAVARANLDGAELPNCQLRQADMRQLPLPAEDIDVATFHLVLHYAEDPAEAITEATRVLRPGGRLIIVDFAPHKEEHLVSDLAHRWMGFNDNEIKHWCRAAELRTEETIRLPGDPLTVCLWSAKRRDETATKEESR